MANYQPSRLISHLLTAYAVQSSVQYVCAEFLKRFNQLKSIPIMFYDWQQGFSEQLKQALARVPQQERNTPWFTILYSYGAAKPNPIQPRPLPEIFRQLGYTDKGEPIATELDARYAQIVVVCDIITNDSNYADSLSNHRMLRQSYWDLFEYQDILFPTWKTRMNAYRGMYLLPTMPNGYLYQCTKSGVTGRVEPNWSKSLKAKVDDGSAQWECIKPKKAKASVSHITLPELTTAGTYQEGIRYNVRFGYGLNFVALEDLNNVVSGLLTLDNYVYSCFEKEPVLYSLSTLEPVLTIVNTDEPTGYDVVSGNCGVPNI